ncbi:anti-sigma factor RsbA family regulatory protein [Nocardia sp. NPDC056000]|uniref:anti-sigma factor RsbA family regulatory protein n=1 Tax=Nocardia sp. NPDC056000 TaxID=3345674 RepID=UPI0035DB5B81
MSSDTGDAPSDPFLHPAFFYRDSHEYLSGTMEFIRAGLANAEPVAVAVPAENLDLLRDALGADAGAVRLLDMSVAGRNPGRIIPGVLRAFTDRHPDSRVRIIGEPIWAGRSALEYPACAQHEALINTAFAGRAATMLCPYDIARLDPGVLDDALMSHPTSIDTGVESISPSYDPDRVVAVYNQALPEPPAAAGVLDFDEASLADIRYAATEFARDAGMSSERGTDLELAVAEATTNSVVHGGGRGIFALWSAGRQIICQVRDRGYIADPLAGRLPVPGFHRGGRGLLLVNQLCDLVRMHTTPLGTTLQMHFAQ